MKGDSAYAILPPHLFEHEEVDARGGVQQDGRQEDEEDQVGVERGDGDARQQRDPGAGGDLEDRGRDGETAGEGDHEGETVGVEDQEGEEAEQEQDEADFEEQKKQGDVMVRED